MNQIIGKCSTTNFAINTKRFFLIRPFSKDVVPHCLFWSEDKQKDFFTDVHDFAPNHYDSDLVSKAKDINPCWIDLDAIPQVKRGTKLL